MLKSALLFLVVCVIMILGSTSWALEFGEPLIVSIYCDTKDNMVRLLQGKELETEHCFMGAAVAARYVKAHGLVKAKDGKTYEISSLVPVIDFKWDTIFSFVPFRGKVS